MSSKKYVINEKERTIYADISKISDTEKEEILELTKFGYTFVQKEQPSTNPLKGKKIDWFEKKLSKEEFAQFKEEIAKESYMAVARRWLTKIENKQK